MEDLIESVSMIAHPSITKLVSANWLAWRSAAAASWVPRARSALGTQLAAAINGNSYNKLISMLFVRGCF